MNYFDAHTHKFENTKYAVFSLPIHEENNREFKNGLFSIGWHPWYLNKEKEHAILNKIISESKNKNIIAIGETGLDKLCSVPFEYQKEIFMQHIFISETEKKPLIIHCVRCFAELLQIKKITNPKMQWIVHGFNNKIETANQLIQAGIKLSFGKALQTPDSNAAKVISQLKPSDFLLETDDGTLTIDEIYIKAALYSNINIGNLIQKQKNNFIETFTLCEK